jgi:polygalacturonase
MAKTLLALILAACTAQGATTVVYASHLAGIHLDGSATANTGTDDRATLQAALTAGPFPLTLIMDGTAAIDSTGGGLVMKSSTTIQGAGPFGGFTWLASTNLHQQPMIVNEHPLGTATPIDHDIDFEHVYINGNRDFGPRGAGGTELNRNSDGISISSIRLVGVTNVTMNYMGVWKSFGFATHLANVTNVNANHWLILNNVNQFGTDGLHFNGPASNITLSNFKCKAGDDCIALNANDWHQATAEASCGAVGSYGDNSLASTTAYGDITDVAIDVVVLDGSWDALRMLSAASTMDRISLNHVSGTYYQQTYFEDNTPSCFPGIGPNFGATIAVTNVTATSIGTPSPATTFDSAGFAALAGAMPYTSQSVGLVTHTGTVSVK